MGTVIDFKAALISRGENIKFSKDYRMKCLFKAEELITRSQKITGLTPSKKVSKQRKVK